MKRTYLSGGFTLLLAGFLFAVLPLHADDDGPASLEDVHKTLLQAAGYQADTPPTPDQQEQLLNSALKMLRKIPHVYRGQLRLAARSINNALNELSNGDPAHKAREDIFDADDQIKSVMN
jgi:hypothetical protein